MRVKLRMLVDGDRYKLWAGGKIGADEHGGGDPDTYLLARLEYTDEWGDEIEYKYHMSVVAVGPRWPSAKELQSHLNTLGMTAEEFHSFPIDGQLECLLKCGLMATLWQETGNNERKLVKAAREQIAELSITFGFRMGRAQNAIGSTGWDFVKGDILAGHHRTLAISCRSAVLDILSGGK